MDHLQARVGVRTPRTHQKLRPTTPTLVFDHGRSTFFYLNYFSYFIFVVFFFGGGYFFYFFPILCQRTAVISSSSLYIVLDSLLSLHRIHGRDQILFFLGGSSTSPCLSPGLHRSSSFTRYPSSSSSRPSSSYIALAPCSMELSDAFSDT